MNEFIISVIGWLITIRKLRSDTIFSYFPTLRKLLFLTSCVVGLFSPLFIGIFFISLIIISIFLEKTIEKKFDDRLLSLLDRIILSQKAGKSFRQSTLAALQSVTTEYEKSKLQNLVKALSAEVSELPLQIKKTSTLFLFFMNEVIFIGQQNTLQLEQTLLLRRQIKIILQLRHKSGQAAQQAKAQALIIAILFVGMTIFLSQVFGWQQVRPFFLFSLPILSLGVWITWKISGRFKWSI